MSCFTANELNVISHCRSCHPQFQLTGPRVHHYPRRTTVLFPSTSMSQKQQLQKSLSHIEKSATDKVHSRLATIQANDINLTKQTKVLQSRTQEARKHQDHWNNIVRAGRNGMKVHLRHYFTGTNRFRTSAMSLIGHHSWPGKSPSSNTSSNELSTDILFPTRTTEK